MGKSTINGLFSIALLVYQRVIAKTKTTTSFSWVLHISPLIAVYTWPTKLPKDLPGYLIGMPINKWRWQMIKHPFCQGVKPITQDFNQVSTCFNKHQQIKCESRASTCFNNSIFNKSCRDLMSIWCESVSIQVDDSSQMMKLPGSLNQWANGKSHQKV